MPIGGGGGGGGGGLKVTVTDPKPPAAGGGAAGAEPVEKDGVATGGSMVTDTDEAPAGLAEMASTGVEILTKSGDVDGSTGADEGSVGIAAPHLMQNLVVCSGSNPQATHFKKPMIYL